MPQPTRSRTEWCIFVAWFVLFTGSIVFATAAVINAQEPPKKPVDPIVEEVGKALSPEGIQERQLRAIKALVDAYEREKSRADVAEAKLKEHTDSILKKEK